MDGDVVVALGAFLAEPDPPDLCTASGAGRRHHLTVPGREDRFDLLAPLAQVHRTWALVARDNERLQ